MKQIFLSLVLAFCASLNVMAGSNLKVTSGDKNVMKTIEGTAHLVFVWDKATYDGKQPLAEKFPNFEELKTVAWNGFVEEFNKKSKKVQVVKNEEKANYKFVMKVVKMDQYFKVMGFIPSNATKVWGKLTIINLANNKKIAEIDVDEVDGGANPSPDGTFSDCFEALGKKLAKLK